ncbi:MAG: TVP38/TMEM64 family protein [Xanthomonadales bacterium]|nr:TVP38/TMEM64 family protein [Xanthomonadales bacterium]
MNETVRARRQRMRALVLALLAVAVVAPLLVFAWQGLEHPSWRELVTTLLDDAARWRAVPFAPLVALAVFMVGGLVMFPITWMTAATMIVFGPWLGGVLAMIGGLLDAWLVYELGRLLPADLFDRWFGERGQRLRARVVGHGLIAMIVLRLVPVAPYSVVSFLAGAARLGRRDFLIGSAVGMVHDVILYGVFAERARAVLLDPHPLAFVGLVAAVVLLIASSIALHFWHRRRTARHAGKP